MSVDHSDVGPILVAIAGAAPATGLILLPWPGLLPTAWVGPWSGQVDPADVTALLAGVRPCPLLPAHGEGWFGRPGLSGHRLGAQPADPGNPPAGRDWSPLFRPTQTEHTGCLARIEAADPDAGLALVTEIEVERLPSDRGMTGVTTIGGGELLLPGEVTLAGGESYATPWVYLAASRTGLDDLSAQFHGYLRSRPAHPSAPRPVNLNVWEAVYFDHDFARLAALADLAATLGAERYVLDDGWFRGRRHDRAGLGDWQVDEEVWPGGLGRLVDHVRARGLQFGLWIEPEMVNPDSDLYRAHPDWILAAGHRLPPLQRHQLVLDLTRPEVYGYLLGQISSVLASYDISYVKWDCNRDIIDAGSGLRAGAPAAHGQALAVYALLDELRSQFPDVEWESCAAGGGRIDLGILERVQRVWTSDMTDALARQPIQRWTGLLVPPEYLGAHVSAAFSHQTGRYMPMAMRCATAMFGHFGIEADITQVGEEELTELAAWIRLYRQHRELIHGGRVVRIDTGDDAGDDTAWMHGVVAADRGAALMCCVQLDEPRDDRPAALRIPGLDPGRRYLVTDVTPGGRQPRRRGRPAEVQPRPAMEASGAAIAEIGLAIPPLKALNAAVLLIQAR